jgi:hypothetical protein
MNKVTRLLLSAMCLLTLATASLSAQGTTYEVNFASISFINIELNSQCSRTVIYRNLLSGLDDVDGDGLAPPEAAFIITIDDAIPGNNQVLDGCGSFRYTIRPNPDSIVLGFTFGSGTIVARDVTPPAVSNASNTAAGPFFTPDLQSIIINTLPNTVFRSYRTNGTTGFPIMASFGPGLFNRLRLGGTLPQFRDACSAEVLVIVSDEIQPAGECDDIVITRTFTATDASTTCSDNPLGSGETVVSYDIILERPDVADVQAPPSLVTYECNDPAVAINNFPNPDPEDYPFFNRPDGPLFLNGVYGNVGVSFTNSGAITICNSTIKYVRTYTVIDWCNTNNVLTFTQLVKVGDSGALTIQPPTQDLDFNGVADTGPLVYSTNAHGCGAFINTNASGLAITDGCSAITSVEAFVLFDGLEAGAAGPIRVYASNPINRLTPFVPAGPHILRYVATDECGNVATIDLDILIEDRTGPAVIVEDALNVALSNNGFANVTALDMDEGSYDDCGDIILEIAFVNPSSLLAIGAFGRSITLSCIDVGSVPVIIRATDENGNENTRISVISVIDNSAPICIAPGNLAIDCDQADDMLPEDVNVAFVSAPNGTIILFNELFGAPTSLDNCGNEQSNQQITSDINDCGTGRITRTFTVTDSRGFASAPGCNQIISIRGVRNYTVEFPGDAETTCGNDPEYDDLAYTALGCDMVVTFVEVDTFFSASDACFKLRRTMEIINWCEYNGNDPFYTIRRDADIDGNFGESTFLHVIPNGNLTGDGDVAVLDRDADRDNNNSIGFVDVDDLVGNFDSDNDGDTGYENSDSRGAFRYIQFVKVYDDNAPTITNVSADATPSVDCDGGGIQIDYSILDDCVGANLTTSVQLDADYVSGQGFIASRSLTSSEIINDGSGNITLFIDNLPAGQHAVRVRATDGCGNTDGRVIPFTIEENSLVTPICARTLVFFLNPDGAGGGIANVEADDYIIDLNNNCGDLDIEYAIYRELGEADQPGFTPVAGRDVFEASCADNGENLAVRIYTFTPNGNNTFCNGTAIIQTSGNVRCTSNSNASISGFVTSPTNDLLRDIPVHISDMRTMSSMMPTDNNGSFLFTALTEGTEYMVQPRMGEEVNLRRVKTSDITVISAHVLGVFPIENPYRLIAADVTGDGFVNIRDMIAISRVILGLDQTYPESPTWRFIRRDFDVTGLTEGWNPNIFPTTYTVEELHGHNRDADFVAVEIGDIFIQAEGRESLAFEASDALMTAGERTKLTISANDFAAFQGTIEATPGLTIESWSSELLASGNVNDHLLDQGLLSFSYWASNDLNGADVITLQLLAKRELRISDYLKVTDRMTVREATSAAGTTAALGLDFSAAVGGEQIILHQNFPNPVAFSTSIVFELPTTGKVSLEVRDIQGRLLTERRLTGFAGRNTITLSNDDFRNTTGILSYTLLVGQKRLTKRMTVVATR